MARRKIRPGPLEARSAAILRAIIEEYVATAQPVGSAALVEKYGLGHQPGHGPQRHGRAGDGGAARPSAHERGPGADRPWLSPVRRVDLRLGRARTRRAADDPSPVRPGRVHVRAVVPPRGFHARVGDALRGDRDPGEAACRSRSTRRCRPRWRPARQPRRRPRGRTREAAPARPRPRLSDRGARGPRRAPGQPPRGPHGGPGR